MGRVSVESSTSAKIEMQVKGSEGAMHVKDVGIHPGEDEILNRTWGGQLVEAIRVTGDIQVVLGACAVVGFVCTAGTSPTLNLYDGISASGVLVYGGGAAEVLGAPKDIAGGAAVFCSGGLYADVGGTTPAFTIFVVR